MICPTRSEATVVVLMSPLLGEFQVTDALWGSSARVLPITFAAGVPLWVWPYHLTGLHLVQWSNFNVLPIDLLLTDGCLIMSHPAMNRRVVDSINCLRVSCGHSHSCRVARLRPSWSNHLSRITPASARGELTATSIQQATRFV